MATLNAHKLIESEAPPRTAYSNLYDYDGNGNLIYQGWAVSAQTPNAATAMWAVKKFVYTLTSGIYYLTSTQWANGSSSAANIWNNRTSLSYK